MTINKTALENFIEILDDPTVTTCDDIDDTAEATSAQDSAFRLRYHQMVSDAVNRMRRKSMDRARAEQLARAEAVSNYQLSIRSRGYDDVTLRSIIAKRRGAAVGHRDLKGATREDLETQLADLMALDAEVEE
jgi:hypothetical protein